MPRNNEQFSGRENDEHILAYLDPVELDSLDAVVDEALESQEVLAEMINVDAESSEYKDLRDNIKADIVLDVISEVADFAGDVNEDGSIDDLDLDYLDETLAAMEEVDSGILDLFIASAHAETLQEVKINAELENLENALNAIELSDSVPLSAAESFTNDYFDLEGFTTEEKYMMYSFSASMLDVLNTYTAETRPTRAQTIRALANLKTFKDGAWFGFNVADPDSFESGVKSDGEIKYPDSDPVILSQYFIDVIYKVRESSDISGTSLAGEVTQDELMSKNLSVFFRALNVDGNEALQKVTEHLLFPESSIDGSEANIHGKFNRVLPLIVSKVIPEGVEISDMDRISVLKSATDHLDSDDANTYRKFFYQPITEERYNKVAKLELDESVGMIALKKLVNTETFGNSFGDWQKKIERVLLGRTIGKDKAKILTKFLEKFEDEEDTTGAIAIIKRARPYLDNYKVGDLFEFLGYSEETLTYGASQIDLEVRRELNSFNPADFSVESLVNYTRDTDRELARAEYAEKGDLIQQEIVAHFERDASDMVLSQLGTEFISLMGLNVEKAGQVVGAKFMGNAMQVPLVWHRYNSAKKRIEVAKEATEDLPIANLDNAKIWTMNYVDFINENTTLAPLFHKLFGSAAKEVAEEGVKKAAFMPPILEKLAIAAATSWKYAKKIPVIAFILKLGGGVGKAGAFGLRAFLLNPINAAFATQSLNFVSGAVGVKLILADGILDVQIDDETGEVTWACTSETWNRNPEERIANIVLGLLYLKFAGGVINALRSPKEFLRTVGKAVGESVRTVAKRSKVADVVDTTGKEIVEYEKNKNGEIVPKKNTTLSEKPNGTIDAVTNIEELSRPVEIGGQTYDRRFIISQDIEIDGETGCKKVTARYLNTGSKSVDVVYYIDPDGVRIGEPQVGNAKNYSKVEASGRFKRESNYKDIKKEVVDFRRKVTADAAVSENFDLAKVKNSLTFSRARTRMQLGSNRSVNALQYRIHRVSSLNGAEITMELEVPVDESLKGQAKVNILDNGKYTHKGLPAPESLISELADWGDVTKLNAVDELSHLDPVRMTDRNTAVIEQFDEYFKAADNGSLLPDDFALEDSPKLQAKIDNMLGRAKAERANTWFYGDVENIETHVRNNNIYTDIIELTNVEFEGKKVDAKLLFTKDNGRSSVARLLSVDKKGNAQFLDVVVDNASGEKSIGKWRPINDLGADSFKDFVDGVSHLREQFYRSNTPNLATNPEVVIGRIQTEGNVYTLDLHQGDAVRARIVVLNFDNGEGTVKVYGPDGHLIVNADGGVNSKLRDLIERSLGQTNEITMTHLDVTAANGEYLFATADNTIDLNAPRRELAAYLEDAPLKQKRITGLLTEAIPQHYSAHASKVMNMSSRAELGDCVVSEPTKLKSPILKDGNTYTHVVEFSNTVQTLGPRVQINGYLLLDGNGARNMNTARVITDVYDVDNMQNLEVTNVREVITLNIEDTKQATRDLNIAADQNKLSEKLSLEKGDGNLIKDLHNEAKFADDKSLARRSTEGLIEEGKAVELKSVKEAVTELKNKAADTRPAKAVKASKEAITNTRIYKKVSTKVKEVLDSLGSQKGYVDSRMLVPNLNIPAEKKAVLKSKVDELTQILSSPEGRLAMKEYMTNIPKSEAIGAAFTIQFLYTTLNNVNMSAKGGQEYVEASKEYLGFTAGLATGEYAGYKAVQALNALSKMQKFAKLSPKHPLGMLTVLAAGIVVGVASESAAKSVAETSIEDRYPGLADAMTRAYQLTDAGISNRLMQAVTVNNDIFSFLDESYVAIDADSEVRIPVIDWGVGLDKKYTNAGNWQEKWNNEMSLGIDQKLHKIDLHKKEIDRLNSGEVILTDTNPPEPMSESQKQVEIEKNKKEIASLEKQVDRLNQLKLQKKADGSYDISEIKADMLYSVEVAEIELEAMRKEATALYRLSVSEKNAGAMIYKYGDKDKVAHYARLKDTIKSIEDGTFEGIDDEAERSEMLKRLKGREAEIRKKLFVEINDQISSDEFYANVNELTDTLNSEIRAYNHSVDAYMRNNSSAFGAVPTNQEKMKKLKTVTAEDVIALEDQILNRDSDKPFYTTVEGKESLGLATLQGFNVLEPLIKAREGANIEDFDRAAKNFIATHTEVSNKILLLEQYGIVDKDWRDLDSTDEVKSKVLHALPTGPKLNYLYQRELGTEPEFIDAIVEAFNEDNN